MTPPAATTGAMASARTPYPQAARQLLRDTLFGAARARTALGEPDAARGHRDRLLREFKDTPWARRMKGGAGPNP